jgi:archaellum biogenesis ATPase FlaH
VGTASLLSKHFDKSGLIELWPRPLNDLVDGGAKPGHHILVFAPTEMGKTLMVINMVAGFLRNGHRVLYIGNEDPAPDILMRMMTRMTGLTKYEIMEKPDEAQKLLDQRNWNKFVLAALAPGSFGQIQKLVEKHNPKVVVLDQLRNLNVESENRTQALEKAATSARNLAKRNNVLVVSVTQAADSASVSANPNDLFAFARALTPCFKTGMRRSFLGFVCAKMFAVSFVLLMTCSVIRSLSNAFSRARSVCLEPSIV